MTATLTLAQAAHAYAAAGYPVFPLLPRGKKPKEASDQPDVDGIIVPKGRGGFHRATCDLAKIARWWDRWPDANVGMATGQHRDDITGELVAHPFDVLDVDPDDGGLQSLARLEAEYGPLPEATPRQRTGSGGLHYLFASDGTVKNSAGDLAPGIDVRGSGGYIVVAPSIHPDTLEPYRWEVPLIGGVL